MRSLWMMFVLAAFPACSAIACPPGTAPQQGIGWQGCAPVPGTGLSTPSYSAPREIWADRWGAIAVDESNVAAGIGSASGMKRKGQAERAALKDCQNKGIARCKVKFTYYNQCAVVVWGDRSSTVNGAASIEKATQLGLEKCTQSGDSNCEAIFSKCSYPEQVR
jgi:hypothetical protein